MSSLEQHLSDKIPEWNDDKIMEQLMVDFKFNRSINPEAWDKKLDIWSRVILESSKYEKKFYISLKTILQYICRKERNSNHTQTPLGWKIIIVRIFFFYF
jgi:hypothetical protein